MHEVSFQDKEKEHLTRLQDAEEMKVSVWTGPLSLGESLLPRCGAEGAMLRSRGPSECRLV